MTLLEKIRSILRDFVSRVLALEEYVGNSWRQGANRRTIFILLLIGSLSLYAYLELLSPPESFPLDELVEVPEGILLEDLAKKLEESHVIRSEFALRALIVILDQSTSIRAGDYLFKEPKNLIAVARAITTGAYGLEPVRVRIPEGSTTMEMGKIFEKHLKRIDSDRFTELASPYEGYLFPDTYYFLPNATEDTIIRAMRQNFDEKIATVMGEIVSFGKPLSDIIIMASLLEREAHIFQDRRMIAGVLWRRIDKGMLLQVDASFLYSIGRTTFDLTKKDLASKDDPYNTYVHKGLPPTPIGSPSLPAIRAAVTPIDQGNLFYLADRTGTTYYSKTYEEHLRKKSIYID